jgi:hypothetical protein
MFDSRISISLPILSVSKKDLIIAKQILRHFVQYIECLSTPSPLPFYATQIINLFVNSRISANRDKGEGF